MMKRELEADYNKASEDSNAGEGTQRTRRSRNRVVDFADADDELRAEMEKIMAPIGNDPSSFEVMISYGNPPLDKLGKVADNMLKVQGQFNAEVNVMGTALDKMQARMKEMNYHTFGERSRAALENVARGAGKGVKGVGRLLGGLWDAASGAAAKRTEDEKIVNEMQDVLPDMAREMIKLVENIKSTEVGIKAVMTEAEKLGVARAEATRELSIYVGAGKEILRRYKDEYIPEAEADFKETGDPEDEEYLKNVMKRRDGFIDRMAVLEGSRAQSVIAMQQLSQIMDTMEDQRTKIQDIVRNSQNEWKAMLTAAGIAGSSLKSAQNIQKADEFGDKLHEQTLNMIEKSTELTRNSRARGTIDPQKLIEASARLQLMIESESEHRRNRLAQLEQTQVNLRDAADKLLEAADASKQARMLESQDDVGNDNQPAKQSRRRSNGPSPE